MIDPNKNWNNLSEEDKEKVYNSYMGIHNPKLKEDIENLFGKENIESYDNKRTHNRTD